MTLDQLETECKSCTKCGLCEGRTNLVFGVGKKDADIMLIGEGPGENEDLQGEPFVGRSGKLLDKFLESIDLSREKNVYIANMVKCRPPKNRDPKPEEQEMCIKWLREHQTENHNLRRQNFGAKADFARFQGNETARRLYREKRRFDDGHISPCCNFAQPQQQGGGVCGLA